MPVPQRKGKELEPAKRRPRDVYRTDAGGSDPRRTALSDALTDLLERLDYRPATFDPLKAPHA